MPPTDATGLAVKLYEAPFGLTDDVLDVEFEMAPQPRLAFALPPIVIPGEVVLLRATRQNCPLSTKVAVADALIVGAVDRKSCENGRLCWTVNVTFTA